MRTSAIHPARCPRCPRTRRAFTMVEALLLVVVVSIVSVTAIPVLSNMRETERVSALDWISQEVALTRSRAISEGRAYGLRLTSSGQLSRHVILTAAPAGAPAEALYGGLVGMRAARDPATGADEPTENLSQRFPRLAFVPLENGSAVSENTIWFGASGTPEDRSSAGVLQGLSQVQRGVGVRFASGGAMITATVEPGTGAVLR